eukprot:CAMPEP_0197663388 /NCGR_PEP_ID=MMETSP1338-20131121/57210_1 /TAXON_ID=43686 ORGANISM="Pelagodinium beii, Strain RCC1491" /NCGR_SAMPLE_ID=MMETSP1338 /ASSEMBLY_ACC=CAM_ASM_000754 /LENGTH=62 /DNA_ID=CAMNT_0043241723 /DNA_START=509 /DNA_END=697 /DNA_ORIENTATION=+
MSSLPSSGTRRSSAKAGRLKASAAMAAATHATLRLLASLAGETPSALVLEGLTIEVSVAGGC